MGVWYIDLITELMTGGNCMGRQTKGSGYYSYGKVGGLGGAGSWAWGGASQTTHLCSPRVRVQWAPRKWEVSAAPPLPRKLAGGDRGHVLRPDHFLSSHAIRHAYQMGGSLSLTMRAG